ncbi:peroxisomal N(1)-acetyl-spermine/spermidine oxidase [Galendromus occidentalis]|uniref:Peroxisomal N(1)-acetyl-spermine/spermidine oxidase n=1 Tax=Galendromus occidentalis TaxID=34638 RepID=A0AAJ6QPG2_9ACAR|nr:peroxisomal N(1)-acetyl-spermine/spermidine oxidase [Galendromus occidentalis]
MAASSAGSSPQSIREVPNSLKKIRERLENFHNIIVIGAGIAGLSTAYHILSEKPETDVLILEARDRLGGRANHSKLGDVVVELGPKWIHGVLGNPLYEFAVAQGLVGLNDQKSVEHNIVAATEKGNQVPLDLVDEIYSAYFWFGKRCEEYHLTRLSPPIEFNNSVGKHICRDIDAYLRQFHGDDKKLRQMVFTHVLNRDTCISGTDSMDSISLEDYGSFTELPGGNVSLSKGPFADICQCLCREIGEEKIRLKCIVEKIRWGTASETPDADVVRIETSSGVFHCAHLVVTLPLGVLKESVDMFVPHLPSAKKQAIEKLQFGTVNKLYFHFNRPVLNKEISEVVCLWEPCDYVVAEWWKKIFSFTRMTDTILCCWLSGAEAELVETLDDDEIIDRITDVLRNLLSDPYVPRPIKLARSSWKSDAFSRGSFTSLSSQSSQQDIENLAKPVYTKTLQSRPKILFAGEATHSSFYSTAHGAFISGQRCADLLTSDDLEGCDLPSGWINSSSRRSSVNDLESWLKGIDIRREIR